MRVEQLQLLKREQFLLFPQRLMPSTWSKRHRNLMLVAFGFLYIYVFILFLSRWTCLLSTSDGFCFLVFFVLFTPHSALTVISYDLGFCQMISFKFWDWDYWLNENLSPYQVGPQLLLLRDLNVFCLFYQNLALLCDFYKSNLVLNQILGN